MIAMRAKMKLFHIQRFETSPQEVLQFMAVGPKGNYPEDGSDENNTYAKYTPSGTLSLTVNNPALYGKFAVGEEYYLDFTKAE